VGSKDAFQRAKGNWRFIGVRRNFNADDALEFCGAGATLVQAYTGFVLKGPFFASTLCSRIAAFTLKTTPAGRSIETPGLRRSILMKAQLTYFESAPRFWFQSRRPNEISSPEFNLH